MCYINQRELKRDLSRFQRGMKFVHGVGPNVTPMYGQVLRVARDGSWVDMRWWTWTTTWTSRHQPNDPLLATRHRKEWTKAEVAASAPKPDLRLADATIRHPEGY